MSDLRFPLGDELTDRTRDDEALGRIWEGIDASFPRPASPRRRLPAFALATALALSGAATAVVVLRLPRGAAPNAGAGGAGPLRLADGRAVATVDALAGGVVVALSDGSSISLAAGARLEPLESSGSTFAAVLERGSAVFEVRPGGPRRWRIECGLATVEVLGTRFSCDRAPGRLHVAVQRGAVLVSGERVQHRAHRLEAGEALDVVDQAPAPAPAPAVAPAVGEPGAAPAPEPDAPAAAPARPAPAWRDLARGGRHDQAYAALGARGIQREASRLGVADLFVLADVARLSGHAAAAEAPLERILSDFASDPQASVAAFALGRLRLDRLGQPRSAAAALERALALGIPGSLREDVRARLVEAYVRAGDRARARTAADAYAREYPGGRHARAIELRLAGGAAPPIDAPD